MEAFSLHPLDVLMHVLCVCVCVPAQDLRVRVRRKAVKHQKRPLVILGRAPVVLTRAPVNLNRNKRRRRKRTRRRSRRKQVLLLVLTGKVKPPAWETLKASFFFPLNVSVSRCSPILPSLPFLAWLINRCVFKSRSQQQI